MHTSKQSLWQPILAITLIATLAFSVSLWLLYDTAFQRQLRDMEQTATVMANIMEAVAQHDHGDHAHESADAPRLATMAQLNQGLQASHFKLGDEELVIGYRQDDVIKLMRKTPQGQEQLADIPFDGKLAQPMYRALMGGSGNGVLLDYAGTKVLAGYAPVPSLNMAIVFKIPLTQMQAPFLRATRWAGGILLLMLSLFIGGFIAFNRRYAKNIEISEQRFASIVEHIPSMIFMKRANDLSFALINRAGEQLIGIDRQQLMGKTDHDIFPKQQADFFTTHDRQILTETGYQDIAEEQIDTRSNGQRILHTRKIALHDADGKPEYLLGISEDITDRKHHEELIATSNQLLNAIFDSTPVLIAYLDTEMNFVRVNQAYAKTDNKTPDYYIGKNHFDLFPNAENEAIFQRVVETGIAHTARAKPFEYEKNPERGISHWDWTLSPIMDNAGHVNGLVLSLLNVTENINALEALEASEKKLLDNNKQLDQIITERTAELETQIHRNELILDTTMEGYFAADVNGFVRVANPAFCKLLGYSMDELEHMHISQFEANEDAEDVAAHIAKITHYGHDVFDTRHRHKAGHILDVEVSVNLVEISGEKMFYAFVHDISQRKQNEKELTKARDEAQRASLAKSEFLARMSHELRTPMNAILGFTQVMRMEHITDSQQSYLQEIQDAGNHLLALINDLLDLSRIESGRMALTIQTIDAKSAVDQAVQFVLPVIQKKNINLCNDCQDNMFILADPTRLRQVLVNLLSNAAKYNVDNGLININCYVLDGRSLRVRIMDTGAGITPENMNKLFQPFERLGAEHSTIDGTGIGLALSQQLTQRMGGELGVNSSPGKGSTFWIDLPLAPAQDEDSKQLINAETAKNTNKQLVLYIEDNAANLKLVEALFQHHPNMYLLSATTGHEGMELASQYQPDTILLDIHLPDVNGFVILNKLRSDDRTKNIPVIALSADAMPLDVERGLQAGFTDYLTKPIKIDGLITTLEKTLSENL
ncbi:MAG: PAS domain S-box protein [Gammaproteobacteria bacterium]|nr:MAG: PAS domain S-box protein [Gammaproteobacteria bacterium]